MSSTDGGRDTRGKLSWVSDRDSLSCKSAPHVVKFVFLHKLKASCYAKGGFAVPWEAWGLKADWVSLRLAKIKRPSHGVMWQHLTELCPKSTERRPKPLVLSFAFLLMTKFWQVPIKLLLLQHLHSGCNCLALPVFPQSHPGRSCWHFVWFLKTQHSGWFVRVKVQVS